MKRDWLITISLVMLLIAGFVQSGINHDHQKQIDQFKQPQQIVKVEPVKVDAALVEQIEELTRDNERLVMENSALKDEIKAFGWLKDVADKEGLNP